LPDALNAIQADSLSHTNSHGLQLAEVRYAYTRSQISRGAVPGTIQGMVGVEQLLDEWRMVGHDDPRDVPDGRT
jgi:hypothetical protein